MTQHTAQCIEAQAAHQQVVDEYNRQWPKHCTTCGGWGGSVSYYDPSPSGVGLSPGYMTEYDPCPDCTEQNRCPRCGADGLTTDEHPDAQAIPPAYCEFLGRQLMEAL